MSKRFGRNQRRAMRERIGELEEAERMSRGLADDLGKRLRVIQDEMSEWDKRIRQLLGDYSGYARRPSTVPMSSLLYEVRAPVKTELKPFSMAGTDSVSNMETLVETMYRLVAEVEEDPVGHGVYMHCYAGPGRDLGYYMSNRMIDALGLGDEGMRYVIKDVVEQMNNKLCKEME